MREDPPSRVSAIDTCVYLQDMMGRDIYNPRSVDDTLDDTTYPIRLRGVVNVHTGRLPTLGETEELHQLGLYTVVAPPTQVRTYAGQEADVYNALALPDVAGLGCLAVDFGAEDRDVYRMMGDLDWHLRLIARTGRRVLQAAVRGRGRDVEASAFIAFVLSLQDAAIHPDQLIHFADYRGSSATTHMLTLRYPNAYFGYHPDAFPLTVTAEEGLRALSSTRILLGTGTSEGSIGDNLWQLAEQVAAVRGTDTQSLLIQASENADRLYGQLLGPEL